MSRGDSTEHERLKELAALAAIGQLSAVEYRELESHLAACSECQKEYADFRDTLHNELPLLDPGKSVPLTQRFSLRGGAAYRNRFGERARAEGFVLPRQISLIERLRYRLGEWPVPSPAHAYGMVALLAIFVGILGYEWREASARYRGREAEVAELSQENATLRRQLSASSSAPVVQIQSTSSEAKRLSSQLLQSKARYAGLAARYETLEAKLAGALSEAQGLRAEAESEKEKEASIAENLRQTQASLVEMSSQLATLRDQKLAKDDKVARAEELQKELETTTEALNRAKRLLAADRDIRDLMGARNLHITDVYDVDSKGKTRQAFGRAFYTEGKSLIFYAFDLSKSKTSSPERSYQAWGYQEAGRKTQSLGMLYLDDQGQNRWALKFNDAAVLGEIDAVFVTIEPPGGSGQPTGQKLLYAYLGATANHP